MKKLKSGWQQVKNYPIMLLFFLVLGIFSLINMVKPDKAVSALENRPLEQAPNFTLSALINNEWTMKYGDYTKDQFLFRDEWVSMHSICETALGKLENGGVWFAKDGYQIAKNSVLSDLQQQNLPKNTGYVADLASRYPGKVTVMVAPSPANVLSDELRYNPPQIDENKILDNVFSEISEAGGQVVDLRESYLAHSGQQLYYRTDHHWTTAGGALIAYQQFCQVNGLTAAPPADATLREAEGFLGTNFSKTKKFGTPGEPMAYYDLPNLLTVYRNQEEGAWLDGEALPLMDTSKLTTQDKYAAFLWGNNGYSEIEGNGSGSILLIKDSYGNCFAPYLIENYAKIGVVDLRGWNPGQSIDKTIAQGGYEDILVLYSFDTFTQDPFIYRLQAD